jgi:hypothetical protein
MGIGGPALIYKSRNELIVFDKMDNDPNVIRWGYEILEIPYFCQIDKKIHKYKTDIYCEINKGGQLLKCVIEVKQSEDLKQPSRPTLANRQSMQRYNYNMRQYIVNMNKWKAAVDFCQKAGMKMMFLTEKDLQKI